MVSGKLKVSRIIMTDKGSRKKGHRRKLPRRLVPNVQEHNQNIGTSRKQLESSKCVAIA